MYHKTDHIKQEVAAPMHIRKLAKSGNSRYLSIGTILPKDWQAVKVYVEHQSDTHCVLVLEPIT